MSGGLFLVDLNLIDEDPRNPRGEVGDVSDLMQALRERGKQEDPMHLIPQGNGRFYVHEGHRRLKAMRAIGWTQGKAIERQFSSQLDALLSQGQMHAHRKNFDPMAWARYCHRLFFEHNLTREDIARLLGVGQGWVRDHIAFMHLEPWEQRALQNGEMTKAEASRRLADRRAMRDGRPPTAKKTAVVPAQRTGDQAPAPAPHFSGQHPLAEQVAVRCASGGLQHAGQPKIGGVGCGLCWEDVIRADALTSARPTLVAA
jgi:ParB/RepB/Spo0J family partition protein